MIVNKPPQIANHTDRLPGIQHRLHDNGAEIAWKQDQEHQRSEAFTVTDNSALALSRFLGKLNHATQAILAAPLFYRTVQNRFKEPLGRERGQYDVLLNVDCTAEPTQWEMHLKA